MKLMSLKMKEDVLAASKEYVQELDVSRNEYINQAVDWFNKFNRRRLLKKRLFKESKLIQSSSMEVLKDMEALDGDRIYGD